MEYDPDFWAKKFLTDRVDVPVVFKRSADFNQPAVRVEAIGGQAPTEAIANPAVMVETWASTRGKSRDLITSATTAITGAPGTVVNDWLCVGAEVLSDPYQSPDNDHPDVTFYRCMVRLNLRKNPTSS